MPMGDIEPNGPIVVGLDGFNFQEQFFFILVGLQHEIVPVIGDHLQISSRKFVWESVEDRSHDGMFEDILLFQEPLVLVLVPSQRSFGGENVAPDNQ